MGIEGVQWVEVISTVLMRIEATRFVAILSKFFNRVLSAFVFTKNLPDSALYSFFIYA